MTGVGALGVDIESRGFVPAPSIKEAPMRLPAVVPALLLALFSISPKAHAGTTSFAITVSSNSDFTVDGIGDPVLTLERGTTYTFFLNNPGHPFSIKTAQINGTGSRYNNGVTGNASTSGTLIFSVPADAPSTLFYNCEVHLAMGNMINIVDPPPVFVNGFEGP
jgi:hypothetical protein